MRMINKDKQVLGDVLRHNDAVREREEDIQRQEESWREDKRIKKSQG